MIEFLEKLRQKPDKTKHWYAFLGAAIFSGIILIVWFTVVMPDFNFQQNQQSAALAKEPSPLETLKETFSTGAAAIGDQAGQLKASASAVTEGLQQDYAQYASTTEASTTDQVDEATTVDASTTDSAPVDTGQ